MEQLCKSSSTLPRRKAVSMHMQRPLLAQRHLVCAGRKQNMVPTCCWSSWVNLFVCNAADAHPSLPWQASFQQSLALPVRQVTGSSIVIQRLCTTLMSRCNLPELQNLSGAKLARATAKRWKLPDRQSCFIRWS